MKVSGRFHYTEKNPRRTKSFSFHLKNKEMITHSSDPYQKVVELLRNCFICASLWSNCPIFFKEEFTWSWLFSRRLRISNLPLRKEERLPGFLRPNLTPTRKDTLDLRMSSEDVYPELISVDPFCLSSQLIRQLPMHKAADSMKKFRPGIFICHFTKLGNFI